MRPITRDTPQFSRPALPALFALFAVALAAAGAIPAQAAQRTFVSTTGSDASATCSLAEPCRGFAAAIARTDAGGEVIVLDSGGYGSVTVNKNVSIQSPAGVYAGISVFPGTPGVTVASPATKVVLRGLTINGQGGTHGVDVQAGEVNLENVVISNLSSFGVLVSGGILVRISGSTIRGNQTGLRVAPSTGNLAVLVRDSEFTANSGTGIGVSPTGSATAQVTVERSTVARSIVGVTAFPSPPSTALVVVTQSVLSENSSVAASATSAGATIWLRENSIMRNGTGMSQSNSGVINACGANLLVANGTQETGAINRTNCLDQAAATGTVTSIATGLGLNGGPVTSSGTLVADTTYLQRRVAASCTTGSSIRAIAEDGTVACEADDTGPTNAFVLGGNAFGAEAVIGTTDNLALNLRVNNARVMRYEPNAVSPNVIGGSPANNVTAGVRGATIAGGGVPTGNTDPNFGGEGPNRVTDAYGTVGGGYDNRSGNDAGTLLDRPFATVGGGIGNTASGNVATVGGGYSNTSSGTYGVVGGGQGNSATAQASIVGGGAGNLASGQYSAIIGGTANAARGEGSTVGGGAGNVASGPYSWAGGTSARTESADATVHDGAFAWADSNGVHFYTTAPNEFAARSVGGFRFVTDIDGSGVPTRTTAIKPGGILDFGSNERQMISLWGNGQYGIGIQAFTHYARSDGDFAWFNKGVHSNGSLDPGAGGTMLMALRGTAAATPTAVGHAYAATFNNTSDRAAKQDFVPVDAGAVLARVAALPIASWAYRSDPAVRHLGPVAQDFHAAFAVGGDDRTISTVDAAGVALAAIQGLNARLETQLAASTDRVAELERRVGRLALMQGELAALQSALRTALAELQATRTRLAAAD